ncbi:hypothetical protein BAX94_16620 [Elizabethkingia meningoseptica]|uniref:Uncharacterized protein n=1 Tax=Elizabethkingia meningoseptica TaxID=238 RepID=A0A1V3TYS5_ELIME|nr:hypothetical protein BBD33_02820 [Elizabethkingia meningoseptica]AQX11707.1 hypothetical protein BBD35_04620 [Elizabethkingia meningoseptica]AQX46287.1 hypothetical protein B5G46_02815 [Elizabethkingia meningoseptica]KUY18804.1 hypothetical protein ATB99_03225 [Elizabethkingia meningoseptica]ODM51863.1 hypothetical protein BES09_16640 [Elizabethkingia meningoseptica]
MTENRAYFFVPEKEKMKSFPGYANKYAEYLLTTICSGFQKSIQQGSSFRKFSKLDIIYKHSVV